MFAKLLLFLSPKLRLLQRISDLEDLLIIKDKQLRAAQHDPRTVVQNIFKRGLDWYDYTELSETDRKKYYDEAQTILNSEVFQNEKKYLQATGAQGVLDIPSVTDPAIVQARLRDVQMTLNAYELMENRLKEIEKPKTFAPPTEPSAGV